MGQVKQVVVGGTTYNIVQASAVQQKSLLLLLGGKIAFNSASGGVKEIDADILVGALITTPEPQFDQIAALALGQVVKHGDASGQQVTIDDFQGSIIGYVQLLAGAIKENLDDFFTYLDRINAETRKAATSVKAK